MSAQAAEEIEKDLELVGLTAIEDKLQNGVPDAIATLIAAGMKARSAADQAKGLANDHTCSPCCTLAECG